MLAGCAGRACVAALHPTAQLNRAICVQCFNQEALDFQARVLERSGLGEETYLPSGAPHTCLLYTSDAADE